VVHEAAGRPLLAWVLDSARAAGCERIVVVVGHGAEEVQRRVDAPDLRFVLQEQQLGTGHALAQAAPEVPGAATLLVLSGDVPLVRPQTLRALVEAAEAPEAAGAMAVADLDAPGSLGRVLARADGGTLDRIVEAADATPDELAVRTVNAGLYALPAPEVFAALAGLDDRNAQGELYLTDAVSALSQRGKGVALVRLADPAEALGVNDRDELARVHRILMDRKLHLPGEHGAAVADPASSNDNSSAEG